jgi:hypothetical protein
VREGSCGFWDFGSGVAVLAHDLLPGAPLLALDLFARIIAVRIDARPPLSALFTL